MHMQIYKIVKIFPGISCERGWTKFKGSCYKFFSKKVIRVKYYKRSESLNKHVQVNWIHAYYTCYSSNNAELASITSEKERLFAWNLAGEETSWIGGNDWDTEGTFTWSDGTPWDTAQMAGLWAKNQPNNGGGKQHCVQMWSRRSGLLNDISCRNRYPFVCKT